MKVLVFGEVLWDLIDGKPWLGGAPFNFAAHFVRCGGEATLISAVGDDNLGWRALSEARHHGVESKFVTMHAQKPTGTVDVFLNKGEPDYHIIEDVAFDAIAVDQLLFQEKFDALYFGTLARRQALSHDAFRQIADRMQFEDLFYDVNLRKNCWTPKLLHESLSLCTILKLNRQEVITVSKSIFLEDLPPEKFCQAINRRYEQIKTIVITDGSNGCMVYWQGRYDQIPGHAVSVVDAIGAGDAFSAVFMSIFKRTGNPWFAAATANRIGAFVTSQRGAIPEYNEEIASLLAGAV